LTDRAAGYLQRMTRLRPRLLVLALAAAFAAVPAACGEDEANDARDKVEDAAGDVRSEAEDLQDSVDSEGDREKRLNRLERKLEQLRDEGSARADDVRRELEKLRERLGR
jgi:TolA-binding protein